MSIAESKESLLDVCDECDTTSNNKASFAHGIAKEMDDTLSESEDFISHLVASGRITSLCTSLCERSLSLVSLDGNTSLIRWAKDESEEEEEEEEEEE